MGIRSFLTASWQYTQASAHLKKLQSPHGDSFFSDEVSAAQAKELNDAFQSPHGDSFISDGDSDGQGHIRTRRVSIPSRGFVLF